MDFQSHGAVLGHSSHGKNRVRVAKVRRNPNGVHEFVEFNVRVELEGGIDASFVVGENNMVVSTDTCKNHVYMLAKTHACTCPESFAEDLTKALLRGYPHVKSANAIVSEVPWQRVSIEGQDHCHGFVKATSGSRVGRAVARRGASGDDIEVEIASQLVGLEVLKTTQSGWANFYKSACTTLPETDDRILASSMQAAWTYVTPLRGAEEYNLVHSQVRSLLISSFFGPPSTGEFSRGIQETLFKMGQEVLDKLSEIASITLELPNLHFLPTTTLPVFVKNNVAFEDDVYVPTDEPHGIISAKISRTDAAS